LIQSDNGRGNWFLVSPAFLGGKIMRLDKYLKVSRLIKRRTVANEACDAGRVLVNDKPAKASVQVKTGDTVEIQFGSRNVKVEVLEVKETVKKDEVESMFRYI
jgi:ribosomal 50S subunit-recycling heat shock protein